MASTEGLVKVKCIECLQEHIVSIKEYCLGERIEVHRGSNKDKDVYDFELKCSKCNQINIIELDCSDYQ